MDRVALTSLQLTLSIFTRASPVFVTQPQVIPGGV